MSSPSVATGPSTDEREVLRLVRAERQRDLADAAHHASSREGPPGGRLYLCQPPHDALLVVRIEVAEHVGDPALVRGGHGIESLAARLGKGDGLRAPVIGVGTPLDIARLDQSLDEARHVAGRDHHAARDLGEDQPVRLAPQLRHQVEARQG